MINTEFNLNPMDLGTSPGSSQDWATAVQGYYWNE